MPSLIVIPESTFEAIRVSGVELPKLDDVYHMAEHVSASDLADIHVAQKAFPFAFNNQLGIKLLPSPLETLALACEEEGTDSVKDLYTRVNGRYQAHLLKNQGSDNNIVYEYALHVVSENLWVAVQQRLRNETSDPSRLLLRANESFLESLIAQSLHSFKFEEVSSSKIFTYYLGSLKSAA